MIISFCVCVCVCPHVHASCVCVCPSVPFFGFVFPYERVPVRMCMSVYVSVCANMSVSVNTNVSNCVFMCAGVTVCIRMCICIGIRVHMCTCACPYVPQHLYFVRRHTRLSPVMRARVCIRARSECNEYQENMEI